MENSYPYTPKNILITGGAGFIGSHICLHLSSKYKQYNVINLDKLDFVSSLKNLQAIEKNANYRFIKGNLLSADLIAYILKENNIDTIMHFASENHIDNTFGNSLSFTKNNVLATHTLLEAARIHGVKRFVHVSTDEVYGHTAQQGNHLIETSVLEPPNPYAATKAAAEHLVKTYYKSFGLPIIIARINNVYGPHQHIEKMIPKFVCLLERGKPCSIHGSGTRKKRYLYVDDVVRAFDIILHKGENGEIYNIGTSLEVSPLEVARILLRKYGIESKENQFIQFFEDRQFAECRYAIDASKMYALGWQPEVEFDEGLNRTIEWYRKNFDHWEHPENALVPHPHPDSHSA